MTLTELKYVIAVARERHFGRAAETCFVSQPTLSVAVRKLEDELGVVLFERGGGEISVTPIGQRIVAQAHKVLQESVSLREIARQAHDPLEGPLRVGVIHTVGPYLLPKLVPTQIVATPQMPLFLQENMTHQLLELLRQGDIDCAIAALPLPDNGLDILPLYDEPFVIAVPRRHAWANRNKIAAQELKTQTMLLLGSGHCLRDQVLAVCPEMAQFSDGAEGMQRSFEGSSLETIRHMVAAGLGITVVPASSLVTPTLDTDLLRYIPFHAPVPERRIALVWRKRFPRRQAITALARALRDCGLSGVSFVNEDVSSSNTGDVIR